MRFSRCVCAVVCLLGAGLLHAQTGYVTVSGHIPNSSGDPGENILVNWAPVTPAGKAMSYQANGQGQTTNDPVSAGLTAGIFTLPVADTSLTNPRNVCFSVTATDLNTGKNLLGPGYGCVQPAYSNTWCTNGDCNFDAYIPNTAAIALVQAGPPGPVGTANWRGAWTAATAYARNDGYAHAGNGYIVVTAYTSGSTFGSTDTANSVLVATAGADAPNPLLTSTEVHSSPWDDFDAVNGTLMSTRTTPNGFAWTLQGAGGATASIVKGGYVATDNTYAILTDTQPALEAESDFSWGLASGSVAATGAGSALIWSSDGTVSSGSLLHLTFGSDYWNLEKAVTGGAGTLGAMASDPVELHGIPAAQVAPGQWLGGPLRMDGTRYRIRGVIDRTACTLTLYMPDSTAWRWNDPAICTMAAANSVIWQQGAIATGMAPIYINGASIGPRKAANVAVSNDQTLLSQRLAFTLLSEIPIAPTASGWYTIATHYAHSYPNNKMGGTVTIYGQDAGQRAALFLIHVGGEGGATGDTLAAGDTRLDIDPYLGSWAGGVIDTARLSHNQANGALQLDIHVNTPSAADTSLVAVFDGYFTPVVTPVVGAMPLVSWAKPASTAFPAAAYSQTFAGSSGYYTALTGNGSWPGGGIAEDVTLTATAGVAKEIIGLHIFAAGGAPGMCAIYKATYVGYPLLSSPRCSWDASYNVHLDWSVDTSFGAVTVTGNLDGIATVNPSPAAGATALASGSITVALTAPALPLGAPTITPTANGLMCWKVVPTPSTPGVPGTCTAGTYPTCSACN